MNPTTSTENELVVAEGRRSPRYPRQLEVNVDGLEIHTTNVSQGGFQLCCPQMRYPGLQRVEKAGEIHLTIRLPDTRSWLSAAGKVRYANPSDDEYLIGFQITDIEPVAAKQWTTYIATLTNANPDP